MYLGLGSNLGDREETIRKAYNEIERLIGAIKRQSAFYYSEPWGFDSQNAFVNTVILVETELSPHQLLQCTQRIERLMGKKKKHATERSTLNVQCSMFNVQCSMFNGQRPVYHDRPIDIDILLYDDLTIDEPHLKIPHPLMQERPFVMTPLLSILHQ